MVMQVAEHRYETVASVLSDIASRFSWRAKAECGKPVYKLLAGRFRKLGAKKTPATVSHMFVESTFERRGLANAKRAREYRNWARSVCERCEVRSECLAFAMDQAMSASDGLYAGLTVEQRVSLRTVQSWWGEHDIPTPEIPYE